MVDLIWVLAFTAYYLEEKQKGMLRYRALFARLMEYFGNRKWFNNCLDFEIMRHMKGWGSSLQV